MTDEAWSSPAYEQIARVVTERSGMDCRAPLRRQIEHRIRTAKERAHISDLTDYAKQLAEDDAAFDDLMIELSVGETYFFRDGSQFDFLRQEVLPDLLRVRRSDHVVRAWSAGCASGEEAYSLAIVLEEAGFGDRSHVLGTDISRAALAAAREGRYRSWSLRGVDEAVLTEYFHRRPDLEFGRRSHEYLVADRFRRRVQFDYLNLGLDTFPSFETGTRGLDVIVCRNVLIYLTPETVANVLGRFGECLVDGGWLILGAADPFPAEHPQFESPGDGRFYRRRSRLRPIHVEEARIEPPPEIRAGWDRPVAPAPDTAMGDDGPLAEAANAFADGQYARAAALLEGLTGDPDACALRVRALANLDLSDAERWCAEAAERHPLSVELHHLHATALLGLGRYGTALDAAQRVLYLDRSLVAGHFTLATIARHVGDLGTAQRAYRNARDLCAKRPADERVPFCEGESAARLAELAAIEMDLITTEMSPRPGEVSA